MTCSDMLIEGCQPLALERHFPKPAPRDEATVRSSGSGSAGGDTKAASSGKTSEL